MPKANLHGALYDARLTAELLKYLLTKDYLYQKKTLEAVMPKQSKPATTKLADKFASLMQLKSELELAQT